jgi:hypothetical protein
MGHELVPRNGQLLSVNETERRLRESFSFFTKDEQAGLRIAKGSADRLSKLPARVFLGRQDEALARAEQLRALQLGEALVIEFGEDTNHKLRAVLLRDERNWPRVCT